MDNHVSTLMRAHPAKHKVVVFHNSPTIKPTFVIVMLLSVFVRCWFSWLSCKWGGQNNGNTCGTTSRSSLQKAFWILCSSYFPLCYLLCGPPYVKIYLTIKLLFFYWMPPHPLCWEANVVKIKFIFQNADLRLIIRWKTTYNHSFVVVVVVFYVALV